MKDLFKTLLMCGAVWAAVTLLDYFWGEKGVFYGIGLFCVFGFNYEIGKLKERIETLEFRLRDRQDHFQL